MAFVANDRVQVSDQNHEFRNKYGVVLSVVSTDVNVRPDGYPKNKTTLFRQNQLRTSTQPVPVTY